MGQVRSAECGLRSAEKIRRILQTAYRKSVTVTKPVSVASAGNVENKEKGERIKEKVR